MHFYSLYFILTTNYHSSITRANWNRWELNANNFANSKYKCSVTFSISIYSCSKALSYVYLTKSRSANLLHMFGPHIVKLVAHFTFTPSHKSVISYVFAPEVTLCCYNNIKMTSLLWPFSQLNSIKWLTTKHILLKQEHNHKWPTCI